MVHQINIIQKVEPMKVKYGEFINIKEEDKKYFHIYFNENKKKKLKKFR